MIAREYRDPQSGEFSCIVGETVLLKGKTSTSIKRVYDMRDAINAGHKPMVVTTGTGDDRKFFVDIGSFTFIGPTGALKAYRELDKLEAALAGTGEQSDDGLGQPTTFREEVESDPDFMVEDTEGGLGLAQVTPEIPQGYEASRAVEGEQ